MRFDKLAERQILKAEAEGQLRDLKGSGEPLPRDHGGDAAAGAGFRIMAEAGALPREIQLRKAIEAQKIAWQNAREGEAQKREMSKLADLQQQLAIEEEARRRFYSTQ